jgi:hypothetical protein
MNRKVLGLEKVEVKVTLLVKEQDLRQVEDEMLNYVGEWRN